MDGPYRPEKRAGDEVTGQPEIDTRYYVETAARTLALLRASVRQRIGNMPDDPVAVFAAVRKLKDEF